MSIERGDFDVIQASDLVELVEGKVPEGYRVEYKLTTYGSSDKDKHELLKDVSAFANTQGGHLLLGVNEENAIAAGLPGLQGCDTDKEMLRLEGILKTGLEPNISGIRMKAVILENGNPVIVIRVPHSWNPPHRVCMKGSNRFYKRTSVSVYQPDIEELRVLFTQTTSAIEKARHFSDERIQDVCSDRDYLKLQGPGHVFMHIVPIAAFSGMISLDVNDIHREQDSFRILSNPLGYTPLYNYHGLVVTHGSSPDINPGYTQIFRDGCVEATYDGLVDIRGDGQAQSAYVYSTFEQNILNLCPQYMAGLKSLGVPPPFIVIITLLDIQGAKLMSPYTRSLSKEFLVKDLRLPACFLESYGDEGDYHSALRPAFDTLWNTIGYPKDPNYDEAGCWLGPAGYG